MFLWVPWRPLGAGADRSARRHGPARWPRTLRPDDSRDVDRPMLPHPRFGSHVTSPATLGIGTSAARGMAARDRSPCRPAAGTTNRRCPFSVAEVVSSAELAALVALIVGEQRRPDVRRHLRHCWAAAPGQRRQRGLVVLVAEGEGHGVVGYVAGRIQPDGEGCIDFLAVSPAHRVPRAGSPVSHSLDATADLASPARPGAPGGTFGWIGITGTVWPTIDSGGSDTMSSPFRTAPDGPAH